MGKRLLSQTYLETGYAVPRYDLTYWMQNVAYLEASRSCYYQCSFCSLTAEKTPYKSYEIDYIKEQFNALGKRTMVFFLDNNFYTREIRKPRATSGAPKRLAWETYASALGCTCDQ